MSFNFVIPEMVINNDKWTLSPFRFFRRGFNLGGGGSQPSWKDIILHGNTALTLVNAKANGLNYLKLFGGCEQLSETYIDSVTLDGKCEQNGTPTPTVPVDVVCNNGTLKVNRLDLNNVDNGHYWTAGGVYEATSSARLSNTIPVKQGDVITVKTEVTGSTLNIRYNFFNTQMEWQSQTVYAQSSGSVHTETITAQQDGYFNFSGNYSGQGSIVLWDKVVIINKSNLIYTDGTTETVTDSNQLTATAEMLLSVDDYKDTQEVLTGAVTRNVGIKVFNGTEQFNASGAGWSYSITDKIRSKIDVLCTHYPYSSATMANAPDKSIISFSSQNIGFKDSAFASADDVRAFLLQQYNAGTPVMVIYALETATTETVSGQQLNKAPVTVTGSLTGLVANTVSSSHTTPTPTQPLPINTNNGVIKYGQYGKNLFDSSNAVNGYINSSGNVVNSQQVKTSGFIKITPSTTYTISGTGILAGASFDRYAFTYTSDKTPIEQVRSVSGGGSATFITASNAEYIKVQCLTTNIDTCQLELGSTATAYEPYRFGLHVDGTIETVEVTGKNLLNPANIEENIATYYTDFPTNGRVGYHLSLKAGTYTFSVGSEEYATYLRYKDNAQTWSEYTTIRNNGRTQTYQSDVEIAIYSGSSGNNIENMLGRNVQVEKGDTATDYEPYYNGGTATAEMLLKVGTYQDVQEVLTGNVTRNVGVKVLDGTEDWSFGGDVTGMFMYNASVAPSNLVDRSVYCSHFKKTSSIPGLDERANGYAVLSQRGKICIGYADMGTNVNAFKQFLASQYNAGSPVVVVFPLATATTESVTGQPLTIQAGTNVVQITQASMDNLELEVSYKAGVTVTVEEIEDAQLSNDVTVTVS